MDHKKDQGHLTQMEQKWVCPDCETLNTGDCCAVCGCPRPVQKQILAPPTMLEGQGRYEETLPEWTCPDCETRNIGKACTVCGYSCPEKDTSKKNAFPRKVLIAITACVMLLAVAAAGISKLPYWDYRNACDLLENGQYQQAYQAFSNLGTYRNAEQYASDAALQWIRQTLDKSDYSSARLIRDTVSLNPEQSQIVYQWLCDKDVYTYTNDQGYELFTSNSSDFRVRSLLMETLAPDSCRNMKELKQLFSECNIYNPKEFVLAHRDVLETLWYAPVVQNIVKNHLCIAEWLHGLWMTEDHRYNLRFWAGNESDTYSDTTLPTQEEKPGADYYTIQNLTYSLTNKYNVILQDQLRFTLLEPDKIEVYAFKDQNTYTMVRK